MNVLQILTFIENCLQPSAGGKFSIKEEGTKTTVSIFTYKAEQFVFGPTFMFVKETVDEKNIYTTYIQSDMSGIKYKLTAEITDELFQSILEGLRALDAHYMKDFEQEIGATVVPTQETKAEEKPIIKAKPKKVDKRIKQTQPTNVEEDDLK